MGGPVRWVTGRRSQSGVSPPGPCRWRSFEARLAEPGLRRSASAALGGRLRRAAARSLRRRRRGARSPGEARAGRGGRAGTRALASGALSLRCTSRVRPNLREEEAGRRERRGARWGMHTSPRPRARGREPCGRACAVTILACGAAAGGGCTSPLVRERGDASLAARRVLQKSLCRGVCSSEGGAREREVAHRLWRSAAGGRTEVVGQ